MLNNNINESFDSPQFKDLLKAYEDMIKNGKYIYLESEDLIMIAEYYSGKQNAEASTNAIKYALKLHPDNGELKIYHAQIMTAHGKFAEAMEILNSIPEQDDREVVFTKATIALRMDKMDTATKLLEKIAFEEDYSVEVLTDVANVYLDEGFHDKAYTWLQKAYEVNPDYRDLKTALISYYVDKKAYDKVVVILNNMIEDEPYNIDLWIDLTRIYITQNDIEKAAEAIEFALAIDKQDTSAREIKAYILLQQNEPKTSVEIIEQLRKEKRVSPHGMQILLQSYMQMNRFEDAVACSGFMMKETDVADYEIAMYGSIRAYCNLMLGNYSECRKDIETVLKADKEYPNIYTVMGELALIDEKVNEAKKHFAYAEFYAMEAGEIENSIAMAFFRQGYLADALQVFKKMDFDHPEEMKKNYYFMACASFFGHGSLEDTKRALVKGAYYMPYFTELAVQLEDSENPEEREFYRLAVEARELVESHGDLPLPLLLGDYIDEDEDDEILDPNNI